MTQKKSKEAPMVDVVQIYKAILAEKPDISFPVASVKALIVAAQTQKASTMSEFMTNLKVAVEALTMAPPRSFSVQAGCECFLKFLNDTSHDVTDLDQCKEKVVMIGETFVNTASDYKDRIAEIGHHFIKEDMTILVHSYSRVVMQLLKKAASVTRRFTVLVTESRPAQSGAKDELTALGVAAQLIPDSAVGFYMERVDMVFVGAEGVAENGGLINQLGTYQIAIVARMANKPFYAVTESYKFVREFPLTQRDLLQAFENTDESEANVDYTPPQLVSSFITNLGVLTPSAVVHMGFETISLSHQ
ncbi:Translation initiation factor [Phlyctochytrium planicorne]|nr:Translation initiation factor [Phlyctochytrium planicorne]